MILQVNQTQSNPFSYYNLYDDTTAESYGRANQFYNTGIDYYPGEGDLIVTGVRYLYDFFGTTPSSCNLDFRIKANGADYTTYWDNDLPNPTGYAWRSLYFTSGYVIDSDPTIEFVNSGASTFSVGIGWDSTGTMISNTFEELIPGTVTRPLGTAAIIDMKYEQVPTLALESYTSGSFTTTDHVDAYYIYMYSGTNYRIVLDRTTGISGIKMNLYADDNVLTSSLDYWTINDPQDEMTYTPSTTGTYILLVEDMTPMTTESDYSLVFTDDAELGMPSLTSPSDSAETYDTTPTLDWSAVSGADEYQVQVDDYNTFTSPVRDVHTSNSYYTVPTSLAEDTYYWRVRAKDVYGKYGGWSNDNQFTILSQDDGGSGDDAGDSFASATSISTGHISGRLISGQDDDDYYEFEVEGTKITIYTDCEPGLTYSIYIYNPSQNLMVSETSISSTNTLTFKAEESGTWFVRVQRVSGEGEYELTLSLTSSGLGDLTKWLIIGGSALLGIVILIIVVVIAIRRKRKPTEEPTIKIGGHYYTEKDIDDTIDVVESMIASEEAQDIKEKVEKPEAITKQEKSKNLVVIKGRKMNGKQFSIEVDKNQKVLNLDHNNLYSIDLSPLKKCTELELLNLEDNKLASVDLSPLEACTKLKGLGLANNRLESIDLSPLKSCTELLALHLARNMLALSLSIDLSPLQACTELKALNLDNNKFLRIDLSPLQACTKLIELRLEFNGFESIDLSPLQTCTELKELYLGYNMLTSIDLSPLQACIELQVLNLEFNQLASIDLSPLKACTELQALHLNNNKLPSSINLSPLKACTKLKGLYLDDIFANKT